MFHDKSAHTEVIVLRMNRPFGWGEWLGITLALASVLNGADLPSHRPPVDQVDVPQLRMLIGTLRRTHGTNYALADAHEARLAQASSGVGTNLDRAAEWTQLQREVLLFDVPQLLLLQRHEINASHVYTYHNEGFQPGGGLYVLSRVAARTHERQQRPFETRKPDGTPPPLGFFEVERVLVSSPQGEILDCDLAYDGRTVLFSWRQKEDEGYHLWTVQTDGTGLHQLTRGDWHDYNGCWLPDGGIAFVSTRSAQFAYCWNSPVGVVHRMEADGSNPRSLSGNYLNDFTPYPLDDGRIIYSRWEYVDRPAIPIQSLWTLNPDGTGLAGYFGNRVLSPATFMEARSIPGTDRIVCTMTGHNGPTRGAIGVIDRTKGVNAQEAIWNVTPDVAVPKVNEGSGNFDGAKPYSTPVPLDQHRFLVSARGPVLVRTFDGTCQSLVLAKPEQGLQWFSAQPLRARLKPSHVPHGVRVASGPSESDAPAYLYMQDVYNGLEPQVKRGEVKRLRVVRELPKTVRIHPDKRAFGFQFPVISAGATYAGKEVIGEVDVAPDGSASFEVPSGIPIYFMVLDAQGRAVQRMRSFTHLMPGEVQGCIGCHENRGQTTPLPTRAAAMNRPFQKLDPPEWGRGGFDYAAVVQPVLDRHCVQCHHATAADSAGTVDLSGDKTDYFNVSYETLARGRRQSGEAQWDNPYTSWIPTYNGFEANILQVTPKTWGSPRSRLADLLLDGHPDSQGRPRLALTDVERRRIFAWIDLNVPYYGTSETTHPESAGSRRVYPPDLDRTLAAVAARRCAGCHRDGKIPRLFWTRLENPHWNSFLQAPLAREAGGSGRCGSAVFTTVQDPDYQALLRTFDSALAQLRETPRIDMPGAKACLTVNRSCK